MINESCLTKFITILKGSAIGIFSTGDVDMHIPLAVQHNLKIYEKRRQARTGAIVELVLLFGAASFVEAGEHGAITA